MTFWGAGIAVLLLLLFLLHERWGTPGTGSVAPPFTARTADGSTVRLADFAGSRNVVLFFYPRDFTAGCTSQACFFRDRFEELRSLNAVLFGVSADDRDSHQRFAKSHRLPFPLLTDSDRSLQRAYGVLRIGGLIPLPKRVTFVIDRKGVIRLVAHHEMAMDRHVADVLTVLRALQEEGGEAERSGRR